MDNISDNSTIGSLSRTTKWGITLHQLIKKHKNLYFIGFLLLHMLILGANIDVESEETENNEMLFESVLDSLG